MNKSWKTIITLLLACSILLAGSACAPTQPANTSAGTLAGRIVISGSTSMEDLLTAFGEAFTVLNPKVSVEVQGGGSSTGVKNASEGITEIGNSSRALKEEEKSLGLNEHIVAYDGIAVVIHPDNPITNLTSAQIAGIFTGKITNWQEVGGEDTPVVTVLREAGSGTRDGFEELLKIKGQCIGTQEVNETGIVKSTVAGNKNAIGYMSLGKVDTSVKALSVDHVAPSSAAVLDKTYGLQRPYLCLTKGSESVLVQAFFRFIASEEGQNLVAKKGYIKVN